MKYTKLLGSAPLAICSFALGMTIVAPSNALAQSMFQTAPTGYYGANKTGAVAGQTPTAPIGVMAGGQQRGLAGGTFGSTIPSMAATPEQFAGQTNFAPVAPAAQAPMAYAAPVAPVVANPVGNDLVPPPASYPTYYNDPMVFDGVQNTAAVPVIPQQVPAEVMARPEFQPQIIQVPVPVYQPVVTQAPQEIAPAQKEASYKDNVQQVNSPAFKASPRTTQAKNPVPYANIPPQPGIVFEIDQVDETQADTIVSRKVVEMNTDLNTLQDAVALAKEQLENIRFSTEVQSADYYAVVAAVQARLQAGSTPGNPRLVNSWNIAQDRLDRLSEDVGALNDLATRVGAQANMSNFLLEAVRASYGLSGALENDHAELQILEDELTSTIVVINRFLNEITDDINRRTAYLSTERKNLQALAVGITNGELYGKSITNQYFRRVTDPTTPMGIDRLRGEGKKPLAIIRFNQDNVKYQQPVYAALNEAIRRNPDAEFELIAVSPETGSPADVALTSTEARQKAEGVIRTLSNMGLPASKMMVSSAKSATSDSSEVHIYVR